MLARIRKSIDEKDQGFTLIELLVVMIIIGILAAIAIPVFLSQRQKAQDAAVKADVSTVGKEIATYYTDGTVAPVIAITGGRYTLSYTVSGTTTTKDIGAVSNNVVLNTTSAQMYTDSTHWCIALTNPNGSTMYYKYTGQSGLATGAAAGCVTANG